ncbi:MAG TPA: hypothetical protein VHT51_00330 [Micropepsaceae bacterium]|jgi:hypothetical protein|nr:hypothetical protein [Micropepsaceae bacterium]
MKATPHKASAETDAAMQDFQPMRMKFPLVLDFVVTLLPDVPNKFSDRIIADFRGTLKAKKDVEKAWIPACTGMTCQWDAIQAEAITL